jgi:hypothetical protein
MFFIKFMVSVRNTKNAEKLIFLEKRRARLVHVKPQLLLENKVFSTRSKGSFILSLSRALVVEIEKCREIDFPRKATYGGTLPTKVASASPRNSCSALA